MSNLNEIAPYPRSESEVTAESLARSLMVQAQANWHRMLTAATTAESREATNRLVDVYGQVALLKALQAVAPETADEAARDLWADWEDGGAIGERLHGWLTAAGIDPERVNAAAVDAMRDAA